MKLEIKHIAPYLANGLQIANVSLKGHVLCVYTMEIENNNNCGISNVLYGVNQIPVLRPMSDLTKEIDFQYENYNGTIVLYPEKISVMDYLNIAKSNPHKYRPRLNRFEYSLGLGTVSYNFDVNGQLLMPYDIVKLFFINKFDVFDLIRNNLAIDINTLNNKV